MACEQWDLVPRYTFGLKNLALPVFCGDTLPKGYWWSGQRCLQARRMWTGPFWVIRHWSSRLIWVETLAEVLLDEGIVRTPRLPVPVDSKPKTMQVDEPSQPGLLGGTFGDIQENSKLSDCNENNLHLYYESPSPPDLASKTQIPPQWENHL